MGQEGIILITDSCSFVSQLEKNVYVSRVLLLTNNPLCRMIVSLSHWLFHLLFTTSP